MRRTYLVFDIFLSLLFFDPKASSKHWYHLITWVSLVSCMAPISIPSNHTMTALLIKSESCQKVIICLVESNLHLIRTLPFNVNFTLISIDLCFDLLSRVVEESVIESELVKWLRDTVYFLRRKESNVYPVLSDCRLIQHDYGYCREENKSTVLPDASQLLYIIHKVGNFSLSTMSRP